YSLALSSLGNTLQELFGCTQDPVHVTEAAELYRRAIRAVPPDHPVFAGLVSNLGNVLLIQAVSRDDIRFLDEAIDAGRTAVRVTAPGDSEYPARLCNLGSALLQRFFRTQSMVELNEAQRLFKLALMGLPLEHVSRPKVEEVARNAADIAGRVHGFNSDIDAAAARGGAQDTVSALRQGERSRVGAVVGALVGLAVGGVVSFWIGAGLGSLIVAAVGILLGGMCGAFVVGGFFGKPSLTSGSSSHLTLGVNLNDPEREVTDHLGAGPSNGEQRTEVTLDDLAISIASSQFERYELTGDLALLQESIELLRGVLTDDLGQTTRYVALHTLGTALWSLYERLGDPVILDEAITLFETALSVVEEEQPERLSTMTNLASVLALRAWHSGEVDLIRSIELSRVVVAATPPHDARRGTRLGALAGAMQSLGLRKLDSSLLRESKELHRAALAAIPVDSESYPASCSNLSQSLVLDQRSPDLGAASEAVRLAQEAVAATPAAHLLRPRFDSNLANALHTRYVTGHDERDLDKAADAALSAIAATPERHPNLAERLGVRVRILAAVHRRRPDPEALNELIKVAEAWMAATPAGHPNWGQARAQLSTALAIRALESEDPAELATAATRLREVATSEQTAATERVGAAQRWAAVAMLLEDRRTALRAFTLAIDLLPRTAPRSLLRIDQERHLGSFAGLASDAAACALDAGKPELALRLLEQGRGVLLAQAIDARSDLTELRSCRRDLADEFEWLRDALDPEPTTAASSVSAQRRHELAERWEALLADIRAQPGFERFLHGPTPAELQTRCTAGTVVLITVSPLRCDAFLLTSAGLQVLALTGLEFNAVRSRSEEFVGAVHAARVTLMAERIRAQRAVVDTLGWLWDTIAEPVFDALGLTGIPIEAQTWPRIWWVPTGPLTYLPLHAAGHHDETGRPVPRTVLDRAISSYLPTVRSLPAARPGEPLEHDTVPSVLAIAMTVTPGAEDLPGARAEVEHLTSCLPGIHVLTNNQVTRAVVIAALPHHSWAHFACHATSTLNDSTLSHLLVHDHETRPLSVRDVARLRLRSAELVYLSACETTRAPLLLADEAVHITGAFMMAGYTHVIGTLWIIDDHTAARIATDVYATLTSPRPDAARAATALHHAVRRIRDAYPTTPTRWAAHLHVGP
ncbi:MAG: CHAT domain-containing protein, partial [Pseudonocardiaceae bacterium]